ncbi:hypothetical protein [Cryptosporangium japonicum]|uniref:Knr4/Smi1-like domain-containing protein n=1 Tax=Cryptosporangium japonicum TaxID=80872 RepID=A0ABN0U824_9ACTN
MTNSPGWSDEVLAQVRRLWGDHLRPLDAARIHPALSAATRHYLTDVGLPDFEPRWGFECVLDRTDQIVYRGGHGYVDVGGIRGTTLRYGIDIRNDHVFCIDPRGEPVLTAMDPVAMRHERGRNWHGYLNSFEQ